MNIVDRNYLAKWLIEEQKTINKNNFSSHIKYHHSIEYQRIILETNYLSEKCKFSERIYHILNDLKNDNFYCPECGKKLKFKYLTTGYQKVCSNFCLNKGNYMIGQIKKIKKEKYGNENYNNIEKIKKSFSNHSEFDWNNIEKKRRLTKLEKYGNKNFNNREKFLDNWSNKSDIEKDEILEKQHQSKIKNGLKRYDGISGIYKGISYQSSWEAGFIIFCLENNIQIERNKKGFTYWFKDKKHKYYPDFYLPEFDLFIEVKGIRVNEQKDKLKWSYFPYKLDIYYKEKMKPILDFIINKFGWKFFKKKYLKNILEEYENGIAIFN